MLDTQCTDYPVCPYCGKEWKPDDLYPANEYGYIVGEHDCKECYGGCGRSFIVDTYTLYSTKIKEEAK
jgi:hypothetical protein